MLTELKQERREILYSQCLLINLISAPTYILPAQIMPGGKTSHKVIENMIFVLSVAYQKNLRKNAIDLFWNHGN